MNRKFVYLFCFLLSFVGIGYAQPKNKKLDSLKQAIKTIKEDTNKIKTLRTIGKLYGRNYEALTYFKEAEQIARSKKLDKYLVDVLNSMSFFYYDQTEYDEANKLVLEMLKISESIRYQNGMFNAYNTLGLIQKSQKNEVEAIKYYKKAEAIAIKMNNLSALSNIYMNFGNAYKNKGSYDSALSYQRLSLQYSIQGKFKSNVEKNYNNIGNIFKHLAQYDSARAYFNKAMSVSKNDEVFMSSYNNLADVENKVGNYALAIEYRNKALAIAQKENAKNTLLLSYSGLATSYAGLKNYEKAYQNLKLSAAMSDSIFSADKTETITEMNTKYQVEKKQQQIELLDKDKKLHQTINYALFGGLAMIAGLVWVLYRGNVRKRKDNQLLMAKNEEISEQNEEINQQKEEIYAQAELLQEVNKTLEAQKEDIHSSIRYASRIQTALLPYAERLEKSLEDYFVFYQPKDIVSGDFYWFAEKANKKILIAADCTGHGVPGAFMSVIADAILNQIVHSWEIYSPEKILNLLHKGIRKALQQESGENQDGMDVVVTVWDNDSRKLTFAGAMNALYYVQQGVLYEIKGDKAAIGGFQSEEERLFTAHEISLEHPTQIYLCSDGFQDQFGGSEGKKFKTSALKELLQKICTLPQTEQKQQLVEAFNQWKGSFEQTDDVLIFGTRIR